MDQYLSKLGTEKRNEATRDIDLCTTLEMVTLMNQQDMELPRRWIYCTRLCEMAAG